MWSAPARSTQNLNDESKMNSGDESKMTAQNPQRQLFETADLHLASFLRCRDFTIEDLKRKGGKTYFIFDDSPELHSAILEYANDAQVRVRTFCNTVRDLKGLTR